MKIRQEMASGREAGTRRIVAGCGDNRTLCLHAAAGIALPDFEGLAFRKLVMKFFVDYGIICGMDFLSPYRHLAEGGENSVPTGARRVRAGVLHTPWGGGGFSAGEALGGLCATSGAIFQHPYSSVNVPTSRWLAAVCCRVTPRTRQYPPTAGCPRSGCPSRGARPYRNGRAVAGQP